MRSLMALKDLLLPGLSQIEAETGRALDLGIDLAFDRITLLSTGAPPATLFTRADIESGLIQTEFRKRVKALIAPVVKLVDTPGSKPVDPVGSNPTRGTK